MHLAMAGDFSGGDFLWSQAEDACAQTHPAASIGLPGRGGADHGERFVRGRWSAVREMKLELPPEVPVEEARLLLMVKLFETGRLSLGQAAKLAGYSKRAFMELLGKLGVPVFDYPAEDLQEEAGL